MLDVTDVPELARSGVLKYSYAGTCNDSTVSPVASVSKSYTLMDARAS